MLFIGRDHELAILEKEYKRKGSSFVVIYGRRRVGKTTLVEHFAKSYDSIFYMADEGSASEQIYEFSGIVSTWAGVKVQFNSWRDAFQFIIKMKKNKIVIIIDEFPYLISAASEIVSIFQKIWDTILENEDVMLILVGSSVSIMENEVLSYKSPLYGRRTAQIEVKPFNIVELYEYYGESAEKMFQKYALVDGIPAYTKHLLNKDIHQCFEEFIEPSGFLYNELFFLLKQEFRDVSLYKEILHAIAEGRLRFSEIAQYVSLSNNSLPIYLKRLMDLRLIRKEFPVTSKKEVRNSRYILADRYLDFWFRFIYRNRPLIERGRKDLALEYIKKNFSNYMGKVFEIGVNAIIDIISPFPPLRSGRWWLKDKEIDVVAINDLDKPNKILFIEVKWGKSVDGKQIERELIKKSQYVDWHKGNREEYFMIVARGFKTMPTTARALSISDLDALLRESLSKLNGSIF